MTDLEKAGLRGPVRRVLTELFSADWSTKVMPGEPRYRGAADYRQDGRLQEEFHHYTPGGSSKAVYVFGEDGRLEEAHCSSPAGNHVSTFSYDRTAAWRACLPRVPA